MEIIEEKYMKVIKTGRTHLQDAVPMTFGRNQRVAFDVVHDYDNIEKSSMD